MADVRGEMHSGRTLHDRQLHLLHRARQINVGPMFGIIVNAEAISAPGLDGLSLPNGVKRMVRCAA